jgi:hypothetical protein
MDNCGFFLHRLTRNNNTLLVFPRKARAAMQNTSLFIRLLLVLVCLQACKFDGNKNTKALRPFYGDYAVTFTGLVGGPYEPGNSLVSGTTIGIQHAVLPGTVTLAASQPGVIAVPDGVTIPGVAQEDIIYGAAVMQNPLHVFMGTATASKPGDFGLYSMMRFGLPAGPAILDYTGCTDYGGPFNCVPVFFQSTIPSGDSVNLIYWTIQASGDQPALKITGKLIDRHTAEAAAANLFSVPVESPLLGIIMDTFMFGQAATFELTVTGAAIEGWILATGVSVAGLAPQIAVFEVSFQGVKTK